MAYTDVNFNLVNSMNIKKDRALSGIKIRIK